jgi:general secretion pathway protein B
MSFILDALKKSDSERQRQSGPALFEIRKAPPRSGLPIWALVLGALLLVNLVALAWFVAREPQPAVAPPPAPTAAAPGAGAPAPSAAPAPANPPLQATGAGGTQASAAPLAGTVPVLPPPTSTDPSGLPSSAAIAPGDAFSVQPDYSGNPADYEQALPANGGPGATVLAAERNMVPTVDRLPPALGNQLPPLRLDLHVYASRATDRFVMINMRRLREGDATPEGVRVEEITPAGAVMSFRGTRFLLEQD